MPAAVRQECRIFAILALGLLIVSQYLGYHMLMAYRIEPVQIVLIASVYYPCALAFALLVSFLFNRGKGFFAPLPIVLAFCTLLNFAGHLLGSQGALFSFVLKAVGFGAFVSASLYAFFLFAPPGRKGLILGLTFAAGELIWIVLLPAMNAALPDAPNPAISSLLHKLQMPIQCTIGMLLAATFSLGSAPAWRDTSSGLHFAPVEHQTSALSPQNAAPSSSAAAVRRASASLTAGDSRDDAKLGHSHILPLLFVTTALLYIVSALVSGLYHPNIVSGIAEGARIPLLFVMPLAGALVDRGGSGCRMLLLALALLALAAPAMVYTNEPATREYLYISISVGQQVFLLVSLLLADRLARNRKHLPLLAALAYALPNMCAVGSAFVRPGSNAAHAGWIALGLALACAFLALRLRGKLVDLPAARDEDMPMPEPGLRQPLADEAALRMATAKMPVTHEPPSRLDAFAANYGLSKQEMQVMEMLAGQHSTKAIAKTLGVSDSTVHTYVYRLRQKTGTTDRDALLAFFALAVSGRSPVTDSDSSDSAQVPLSTETEEPRPNSQEISSSA